MKNLALALALTITGWAATAQTLPAAPPRNAQAIGGSRSLSDIAGKLDARRKAGLGKPGTFSAAESTAPAPPPMPILVATEPVTPAVPVGVSASEAQTGWWVYGPGGTRSYHYWQHTGHASASGHSYSGRSSGGHSSRKH